MKIDSKLVDLCRHIDDLSNFVGTWIDGNDDVLGLECDSIHQILRQIRVRTACLQEAVGARPCVGVIGHGQSGKTHMIAGLAGRGAAPLRAIFDGHGEDVDYSRDICGDGPYRSGVVTRFTTDNTGTPTKFPVAIELLSRIELIKILSQCYFSGSLTGRVQVPSPNDIEDLATRLGRHLGADPAAGLSEDEIWTIQYHLEQEFAGTPAYRALAASGYWDYFGAMMPRLSHTGRAALLSVLWGGEPFFTLLYDESVQALEKLGHERQAYCAMSALCNVDEATGQMRATADSIISTEPVFRFGKSDDDTVLVRSKHGAWAAIRRSILAILVGEVRIHLADADTSLLGEVDVLEFPAMLHSNEAFAGVPSLNLADKFDRGEQERQQNLLTLFISEKAGHLFDDYHERRQITCLVVCADAEHSDLSHWSKLTTTWISDCNGASATDRENLDTGLFVVLTKLDEQICQSDTASGATHDWGVRLDQVLINGIGRGSDWLSQWTPGRQFDNLYLLRSPHHKAFHLCDYLDNGMELCIKSSRAGDVAAARDLFLLNASVREFVADPSTAWREAIEPGDGGVSYLSQSLLYFCNSAQKRRQIAAELTRMRVELGKRLLRFYVSNDIFAQHDARHSSGQSVARAISRSDIKGTHGRLLRLLHISEAEISSLLYNLDTNPYRDNANYAPPVEKSAGRELKSLSDTLQAITGGQSAPQLHDPLVHNVPPGTVWHDQGERSSYQYARAIMRHWAAMLHCLPNSTDIVSLSGMSTATLTLLIDELLLAAVRHDLELQIAEAIEYGLTQPMNMTAKTSKAAIISSEIIGAFIGCLGFNETWAEHHPRRKGRARTIIFPPREANNLSAIAEARTKTQTLYSNDWSIAYLAMVEDNAEYMRRTRFDLDEDRHLGEILADLLPTEVWPVFRSSI